MLELRLLLEEEREEFIRRNQAAFLEALAEEMPEGEEVISREEILESLLAPKAQAFQVYWKNDLVGGVVVQIDSATKRNSLDLLFVDGNHKGKGLGLNIWQSGRLLSKLIQIRKCGKHTLRILRYAIFISMSINVAFRLWSFSIQPTPWNMCLTFQMQNCSSVLKKGWHS
ncbi:GNAT family N-acetyltransferase [Streptococcus suis]|uniref:GNAT family N-acetyltransferase n=1 Tax=Streptococcus suis TaxID=1307 RepID=UPI00345C0164